MDMIRKVVELLDEGTRFALGTVVHAHGSTPQKVGCRAILEEGGAVWGTLGGGLVEARGLEYMRHALEQGEARLFEYALDEPYSRQAGPICGGTMTIFADASAGRHAQTYRRACEAISQKGRGLLITQLETTDGSVGEVAWMSEGDLNGGPGFPDSDSLSRCLADETPRRLTAEDGQQVFVEPIVPAPRLLIVGGGHVGQAVAKQAVTLGFDVSVVDDREDFARAGLFPPEVTAIHGNIGEEVARFPKDEHTYIVLVSKGHRPDAEALEQCVHSELAYLGMIGSERKIESLRKHFTDDDLCTEEEFDRIAAPIGVDIGAITVEEIGISIGAQLVGARRRPQSP